jgi:hypothetical protein
VKTAALPAAQPNGSRLVQWLRNSSVVLPGPCRNDAAIPQTLAGGGNCLLCAAILSGVALIALGIYLIWWNIKSIWGRKS